MRDIFECHDHNRGFPMQPKRGMFSHCVHIAVLCSTVAGFGFNSIARSDTDETIPLPSVPQNSRIAIWGDSITEVTLYPRYVEMYLLACAGRKDIRVCTFGHSGETLGGPLSRRTDNDWYKPTLVTILYGMNDTQYSPYTQQKGDQYNQTMHDVLALLAARGVSQVILVGPSIADDTFTRAGFFGSGDSGGMSVVTAQNITLGHFHDIAHAAAEQAHVGYADIYDRLKDTYTLAKQTYGPKYDFAGPGAGIHPAANGHLMIAYELLKAMACDGDIGTINVDMAGGATASAGHTIVSSSGGAVVVDSSRYPFCYNYDLQTSGAVDSMASILPFLPFSRDLNRLILKVDHLDAPSADVTWGSDTKSFTREQLQTGINLAEQFSHTPFDAAFAHLMAAIARKQEFENFMIKGTSNYFGNDNGGNIDENMIAVDEQLDAAEKAMLTPVRHTIAIVPTGASDAAAPIITGTTTLYANVDAPFTYTCTALHHPTSFSATQLPDGLQIDSSTGQITGRPTGPGESTITLTANNAQGGGTATLTLLVSPPDPGLPYITSPATVTATAGQPFTYQITAKNSPSQFFVTVPSDKGTTPPQSSLPAWMKYDTKTGVVSGVPDKAGTLSFQVAAMNDADVLAEIVTLTVKDK
jgi:hypothetical protein